MYYGYHPQLVMLLQKLYADCVVFFLRATRRLQRTLAVNSLANNSRREHYERSSCFIRVSEIVTQNNCPHLQQHFLIQPASDWKRTTTRINKEFHKNNHHHTHHIYTLFLHSSFCHLRPQIARARLLGGRSGKVTAVIKNIKLKEAMNKIILK